MKLKFGIDKSGLTSINTSYEKSRELITSLFESLTLLDYVTLLPNIKSGDLVPLLNFNPSFVAGGCGYSDGNNLVASDVVMTTKLLKSDVTICPNDLVASAFERYLPEGVHMEDIGTVQEAVELFMLAKYGEAIQNMLLTGTAGTNSIDGLITRAYADSNVQEVSGTAPTTADALDKLYALYEKLDIKANNARPLLLVGADWAKMAIIQAKDANYALNLRLDENNGFELPFTNVRVQAYNALSTTNKALIGAGVHMFVGTDLKDDMQMLKIWWSEDNQEIRSTIRFRIGTALAFTSGMARYNVTL